MLSKNALLSLLFFSVSDAKAYVDFILNSIRKKDLFHSIEIKPESCWEYLMWMDQVKYATQLSICTNFINFFHCLCNTGMMMIVMLKLKMIMIGGDADSDSIDGGGDVTCSCRKYPCTLHLRLLEIPRGRGSQKPNVLKLNLNFQGGRGWEKVKENTFCGGGMDTFVFYHHHHCHHHHHLF